MATPDAVAITRGPPAHFFGYYDKFQVDATGTKAIVLEVDFDDRQPMPDDTAKVCIVDLADGHRIRAVGQTAAWCWQ